ncbi:3-(3-hydroxy-phenyl)propionate transporter MhpT [Pseudomonas sp. FSL R10-2964]|uniref:3-(3-hydroxy-phenyl)propionate transporter MhpT n=1 Tax=Pseudomonas sp. FSL R10-2964 TaxID=2662202 RepID=UPI0012976A3B|nr:3-(3-hydroxy-phenyl)propionate transporter MhpT [Pseudomonas sp. FSL R10-2964]MQT86433.1 3-(3-hydroxy-phenyl)propionate transporter MhpT [Pseudomonas sp. FSL R10-2964]
MTSLNLQMARTIGLCFLVALMEGLDLQAAGIAAQGMAAAFELDKLHMSWVFSAGIFGLLPGAFAGGWLADRIGRKRVLMASVGLFGVFSLATALAWDINSLLVARCLTGVGLGAALPNLIALTSEVAGPRLRGTAVSLMYCGVPLGAALAALIGIADLAGGWQVVFYVGGVVPLLIVPLLGLYLPESQQFRNVQGEAPIGVVRGLFREGAALPTTLIWVSYFFTLMVVYILINWLPSLVIGQGFTGRQASWVMLALQIGAAAGTLFLGWVMDRLPAWALSALIYVGILVSLTALGLASHLPGMLAAGFIAGFFATGGQCVLYALAPHFYRPSIRATGVGSAVAIGRLGAMSGPLVAGKMLALGTSTAGVMLASAPGIVIAAVAMFYLSVRRNAASPD